MPSTWPRHCTRPGTASLGSERAGRIPGATTLLKDAGGTSEDTSPTFPPCGYERVEAAAREALGDDPFAYAEGQAMKLDQAVEYALQDHEE